MGESGCGKTSLLHHINGLLKPDDGNVEVFGQPIDYQRLPELRRRMGYAVQSVGMFPHLRIAENIALIARLSGWTTARIGERTEHLMATMKLSITLLSRYPHELSGGQRQRVGMCRAMIAIPAALLAILAELTFSGLERLLIPAHLRAH